MNSEQWLSECDKELEKVDAFAAKHAKELEGTLVVGCCCDDCSSGASLVMRDFVLR